MEFVHLKLKEAFKIDALISLHYFEFARDYVFEGESHDFWEFLYVDKGEVEVTADKCGYILKQGDLIFHKPDEFHSVWANKRVAPNIVVVSFQCRSKAMSFFHNKIFAAGDNERNAIGNILQEGSKAFKPPFDKPREHTLVRKHDSIFGSEQMILIYLETLLIGLVRKNLQLEKVDRLSSAVRERTDEDVVKRLEAYLSDNITANLDLDGICAYMKMSRTHLATLLKRIKGTGVMEHYKNMKIEQAKTLIREELYNVTEVAEILGYSSIHSFSRHFRTVTDMSPSEYAKSVKSRFQ